MFGQRELYGGNNYVETVLYVCEMGKST